jgi:hypothetical protein
MESTTTLPPDGSESYPSLPRKFDNATQGQSSDTLESPICHGRVAQLQDKVPKSWWKTVFADEMYLRTDGDVVEDPDITKSEIGEFMKSVPAFLEICQQDCNRGTKKGKFIF